MANELKGTILHHAFLPIVDIKTLSNVPAKVRGARTVMLWPVAAVTNNL